ncbi:MAG: sulfotransferase [Caulobacteraceae bacterium]
MSREHPLNWSRAAPRPPLKLRALARRLAAGLKPAPATTGAPLDTQGLFVIGAARSGTTILQNALNHSPDIFMLGEPQLHMEPEAPGFAARYNAMHRSWRNQETKSTYLPPLLEADGTGEAYLVRLAQLYRWVGAKIVIETGRESAWTEALFAYLCRRFYRARYIVTFRDPLAVVCSTRDLQTLSGVGVESPRAMMANYARVVALYVRMLRNLPNVRAVFHNDIGPATFDELGSWLGVPLTGAADYYEAARVRRYALEELDEAARRDLDALVILYSELRKAASSGFGRPQLEQNDGHLSPTHFTSLGSITRRAAMLAETLGR